jgi:hypothetical protein
MSTRNKQDAPDKQHDDSAQTTSWLATHVGRPVSVAASKYTKLVAHRIVVVYRRASTRVAGLVVNTIEGILEMVPGGS